MQESLIAMPLDGPGHSAALAIYWIVLVSALGSALAGGVFFAFSNFVMRGLDRLPAGDAIAAMNAINSKAPNPWFMSLLFGTGVLCVADVAVALFHWVPISVGHLIAGAILYLCTSIGVTMWINVPLNIALARVAPAGSHSSGEWMRYRRVWTRWNHVRTVGCTVAATLIIYGMASGSIICIWSLIDA